MLKRDWSSVVFPANSEIFLSSVVFPANSEIFLRTPLDNCFEIFLK